MATKLNSEWKEEPLSTYVDIKGGNGFPLKFQDKDSDIAFLKVSDLGERDGQKSLLKANHTISQKNNEMLKAKIYPANSIIFAKIGAAVFLERKRILSFDACIDNNLAVILPSSNIDVDFLYYLLANYNISDHVTATALPSINIKDFLSSTHRFPEKPEQKAIAKALSDIDELIVSLKLEIAKTQNVKEAVCRPLVFGNTRLNGFTKKWVQRSLGDELGYEQPTKYLVNTTEHQETGNVPVLTAGKSFILGYSDDTEGVYTNTPTILFDDFTTDSKFVDFNFKVKSSACKMIKTINSKGNLRFFHSLMQYLEFRPYDHKRYWISEYSKLEILVPEPIEQNAIAAIVEDFENQIKLLKSELAKYECIKQGMAHDLLTGKVRLV